MNVSSAYQLNLTAFEGPLDLLVHLIEKNKINIYDIPIARLTEQYLDYLYQMNELDMELTSEFLIIASALLHIKSRTLLPQKQEEEEAEEDPREVLVRRLLEYKKIKSAVAIFREKQESYSRIHYKLPEVYNFERVYLTEEYKPEDIYNIFKAIMKRNIDKTNAMVNERVEEIIKTDTVTLRSKIRQVMRTLINRSSFYFSEMFGKNVATVTERITGFMAILELSGAKKLSVKQDKQFSDIMVERRENKQIFE